MTIKFASFTKVADGKPVWIRPEFVRAVEAVEGGTEIAVALTQTTHMVIVTETVEQVLAKLELAAA